MDRTRIAFLLPHLDTGGIEHVVLRLLNGLDRDRFEPVLCLRQRRGALLARLAADVALHDAGGRRSALLARWLAGWLKAQRIDIAYAGTNAMNIAALMAVSLMRKAGRPRLLISEHTSAAAYLQAARHPGLRRRLVRHLYPRADLLLAPTESLARDWIDTLGLQGCSYAVAPNPVLEPDALARLAQAPPPRIAGRVVAAARLVPDKGLDVVIRAVAGLAGEFPLLHLRIFGSGPERESLAALIARLGMGRRITLEGVTDDLIGELATADIFALGSHREGFGNVVVEALAAGARVVATDCAGPRLLLDGGRFGRLVARGDVPSMEAALRATLREADHADRRAAAMVRVQPWLVPSAIAAFEDICIRLSAGPRETQASTVSALVHPSGGLE